MPGHIVVVGSINMDLVVSAPRHPQPGETILGTAFHTFPGGKGANQAVAAVRSGGKVMMIGRVGYDAFGDVLLDSLNKDGVDTQYVLRTESVSSGVALITVSEEGQNNIVVVPGANGQLSPADIRTSEHAFHAAAVVILQLEIPIETVREAMYFAKKHGAQIILNPAPAQVLVPSMLSNIDYLIPNETELSILTGIPTTATAATSLKSIGLRCLIVTLGSDGALVLDDNETTKIYPHTVNVVDTTAAGDAFVGAFAVALTEGRTTRDAAGFANAAGALAVTQPGAQPSLPGRTALDQYIAEHPYRWEREA